MSLTKQSVQDMYQLNARAYDLTTLFYRSIGLRMGEYRRRAVDHLHLKRGDHVVELGCGTGLNFAAVLQRIGAEGHLTGVDFAQGMLDVAQARIEQKGWANVELVQADVSSYTLPKDTAAVLSTGVFGYLADYDRVIQAVSSAILPGGHLSILDGKQPDALPPWLFRIVQRLGRPFGFTPDYFEVAPWQSVEHYFDETTIEHMYGGMIYICAGKKPQDMAEQSSRPVPK